MHELPVTQGILEVVIKTAKQHGGRPITDIYLVIGDLSSIVDDSVQFYFDIMSKDTLAAGATLHFQRETAQATCLECEYQYSVTPPLDHFCPQCQSPFLQVEGGQQFFIESIELADEE